MVIQDLWISIHAETYYKDMWLGWGRSSLEGLGSFLFEYAIPSAILECSHWWSLQLMVYLSGYDHISGKIATDNFSAQVVIFNIFSLIYMVPMGMSYAISALVGANLADNKPKIAVRYAKIAYVLCEFVIFCICCILNANSKKIVMMFETEEK